MASKFKVELEIFGVRFYNQKGLTGQLWSIHGKFQLHDWRAARSEFASLPLEQRVMVVHTTKPFAFRLIRVERTVSHEQDVYFRAALPFLHRIEIQSNIRLDVSSAIKN